MFYWEFIHCITVYWTWFRY